MTGRGGWAAYGRQWLLARSIRQVVLGAGAVLLLLSGLFGGLARADDAGDLDVAKVGEKVHLEPFDITIDRARWSTDLGEPLGEAEDGRFLIVFATISSNQKAEVDAFVVKELLRVQGLDGFAEQLSFDDSTGPSDDVDARVVVTADQVDLGSLNPGLTVDVAFIWEQSDSEPLPTELDLVGYEHGFRQSNIDDQSNWFDSNQAVRWTVPVEELTP